MLIKPRSRLTARDLPFVESPHLAVRQFKQASLQPGVQSIRFEGNEISSLNTHMPAEELHRRLVSGLERGRLFLVHDELSASGPQAPLAVWVTDSSSALGGMWVPGISSSKVFGILEDIHILNREGVTPQASGKAVVGGSATYNGKEIGDVASSPYDRLQDHKLSLPLGAASAVAPLTKNSRMESESKNGYDAAVDLTIGIFTDGTLNNFANIQEFQNRVQKDCLAPLREHPEHLEDCRSRLELLLGESYANEPTNIVKLFSLYTEGEKTLRGQREMFIKVYEPGVGTRSGEDDSVWGMATGLGETGLHAQVQKAFEQVASRIRSQTNLSNVKTVKFDLFGFSRGAAAARYAAHEILNGPEGMLGEAFRKERLNWPDDMSIRFVGLFDTVAGIVNPLRLDFSAGNNRNRPVEINMRPSGIGTAVHLVARDEFRANFSLNSLCESTGKSPSNFREIILPGAHSDVGGGYPEIQVENLLLYPTLILTGRDAERPKDTLEWDNLQAVQEAEKDGGWIGEYSLPLDDGSKPMTRIDLAHDKYPLPDGRVELQLKLKRKVKGELSRIPLHLLYELARKEGVPFLDISEYGDATVPSELAPIFGKLSEQILAGENSPILKASQEDFLKQRFIHHSHHFNSFKFIAWDEVAVLEPPFRTLHSSQPAASNRRVVHWNRFKD